MTVSVAAPPKIGTQRLFQLFRRGRQFGSEQHQFQSGFTIGLLAEQQQLAQLIRDAIDRNFTG